LEKCAKWLVESFNPYVVCFRLSGGQKFQVTPFDVQLTFALYIGGREIIELGKSNSNEEYENLELTRILDFILKRMNRGESFKRNSVICLVNYFLSGSKNLYCSRSFL